MATCNFQKKDGTQCKHPAHSDAGEQLCIFHEKIIKKDNKVCLEQFYSLVEEGEHDFQGFRLQDVSLSKKEFKDRVDFSYVIFQGTTDMRWATFKDEALFTQATFKGTADFRMSRFEKDANFGETRFLGDADFRWAQFGGFAYFWSAEIQGNAFFWMTKYEQNANFAEMKYSEGCSFKDAIFEGDVTFEESKLNKDAVFTRFKAHGEANFEKCYFQGGAFFANTSFDTTAVFDKCHFLQNGIFEKSHFKSVSFVEAFFEKRGIFNESEIAFGNFKSADLRYVRFDGVDVSNVIFEDAHLDDCYISRSRWYKLRTSRRQSQSFFFNYVRVPLMGFYRSMLSSPVKIREDREMMFGNTTCTSCDTVDLKHGNFCEGCNRHFVGSLDQEFNCPLCGGEVDLDILMNKHCAVCKIKFTEHKPWSYDKIGRLKRVENVYRSIKQSLEAEGAYHSAGQFYINEMYMKRLRYWAHLVQEKDAPAPEEVNVSQIGTRKPYHLWRWLKNMVIWLITGYGEKPLRTVLSALTIIFLFAVFYATMNAVNDRGGDDDMEFSEYLYFSVVTFTTLGYGDYSPKQEWYLQMAATVEAFLGAFTMALFVFVFTRKMAR